MDEAREKDAPEEQAAEMPFLDHLEELRWRILKSLAALLVGAILCFAFSEKLLEVLIYPYKNAVISADTPGGTSPLGALQKLVKGWINRMSSTLEPVTGPPPPLPPSRRLQALKPTTYLMVNMHIALLGGLVLVLPVVFYQFWRFVAPGLLAHERRLILPIVALSVLCFALGALFAYWVVLPLGLLFFLSLEPPDMTSQWAVDEYISFALWLLLGFGVVFEMPVLALFLARAGLVTAALLRRVRRYAIVAIFIVAAVFTPPDPVSQTLMAIPLLGLYELSIWVCKIGGRQRARAAQKTAQGEN